MATVKVMRARTVFFIVLIFTCGIISCQGIRTLVMKNKNDVVVVGDQQLKNYTAVFEKYRTGLFGGYLDINDRRSLLDDHDDNVPDGIKGTDDFRPTAPGHSPGAGHNHGPSSVPNSE